jgi:predicted DNA-binding protein
MPHQIFIRVTEEVKSEIERLAAADRRTVSNLVRKIIDEWIERNARGPA